MTSFEKVLWIILAIATSTLPVHAEISSGTAPFILDGNRVYAELSFVRPDGKSHRALAFVDMGSPQMTLTSHLFRELGLDRGEALTFHIGVLPVTLPGKEVLSDSSEPYSIGTELKVEAVLPACVLQKYVVVLDYKHRMLTFAEAGTVQPEGIAVPFHINPQTGLIAVEALIDKRSYAITIDNGSAYTWFRQDAAKPWIKAHPAWERGVGAVGPANMMMSGEGTETAGILLRIPHIMIGTLPINDFGVLAAGKGRGFEANQDLFDWYSNKNALPVIGWIGGNVMKSFRITIDYPDKKMYWRRSAPAYYDLSQVGITLRADAGNYFVAAIATRNAKPTVETVQIGDQIIRVENLDLKNATWGQIYRAMHGRPRETKLLVINRHGNQVTVRAPITAF